MYGFYKRRILLIFLLTSFTLSESASSNCPVYKKCGDCIRAPGCAWCNDENYRIRYSNSTTGTVAQFCGTNATLLSLGCSPDKIYFPQSTQTSQSTPSGARVDPQTIEVDLRIGDPFSKDVVITPADDFPIDMYVLMDLSLTMADDLDTLRRISEKLVTTLAELTSDFRLGFGSFVDKTLYPFSDQLNREYPCGIGRSPSGPFVERSRCDPAYDFKHRLSLTMATDEFQSAINSSNISASFDHPEGLFDALMQVAVCTDTIGWRSGDEARRLILAITDDEYHYALDGKLSGIIKPNDGECHLVDNEYSEEQNLDYPSTSQLGRTFREHSVIPIFAVTANQKTLYDNLVAVLKGAFVGVIDGNLLNLESVTKERYKELSSTVIPIVPTIKGVNISVTPNCGFGKLRDGSSDICVNINNTNPAMYTFSLVANPEVCTTYPEGHTLAVISFVGFGSVALNMSFHCSCDAVCNPLEVSSLECSNNGDLECGACLCQKGFYGGTCECQGTAPTDQPICQIREGASICSGRGSCSCGYCQCNSLPGTSIAYEGDFCQCDREACPKNPRGEICNGHGNCSACTSKCICEEGYKNVGCDCTTSNESCISNEDSRERVCSGQGTCNCGLCLCNNYRVRTGRYCDVCPNCIESCSKLGDCVICKARGASDCQAACGSERNVTLFNNRTLVELTQEYPSKDLRRCQVEYQSCQLPFYLDSLLLGTETNMVLSIYVESRSGTYQRIQSNDCGETEQVWPIVVGIVLGIIVLGLLALIIWRAAVYWKDYMEYRDFLKNQEKNQVWSKSDNPMYVAPAKEYQNPQYRKKEIEAFGGTEL